MNTGIMKAVLGLEDGTWLEGEGFGVPGETTGELVFSTQMTGYMEALTDPSYHGQILMFTFPMIGNYGVDEQNFQSRKIWARGCVVREICETPDNGKTIRNYFEKKGLLGISGIDTRRLTIKTRCGGTLRAGLIVGSRDHERAIMLARSMTPLSGCDLIPDVTTGEPSHIRGSGPRVAALDLGIKKNMIVSLRLRDADVWLYPAGTPADVILSCRPAALFISNGPGDPKRAVSTIETLRRLAGVIPLYGICMGNQVCALALGGRSYKMKFGHRGSNQPVRHTGGGIYITTQNHGYAVDADSLPEGCSITYTNVNDGTVEGFSDPSLGISCVQFHPEANGGPRDTEARFFDDMFRRLR